MKKLIFHIEGGIGKNIMATAVVKAIKKKYPDSGIIVTTAWEDVWNNNPNVERVYNIGNHPYFYEDNIKDKDSTIWMHNPYQTTDYIYEREHLIKIWCELYDVEYDNETPELYFTDREIDFVRNQIVSKHQKPIFLIQPNGGFQGLPYSWARDLPFPVAQEVVNYYKDTYDVLQIRRDDQLQLKDTFSISLPIRQLMILVNFSQKRLLIDSFVQHAAAALGLSSTVCWIVNSPKVLGYELHKNIKCEIEEKYKTTKNSYLSPYDITGNVNEFPYDTSKLFDVSTILDSLDAN